MDVTCERCQTEYEFDETLISDRGTTVKCTHCGHLFKIFRTGSGAHSLPGGTARVWTLRRRNGETLTFDRLATLQQWILDGRVTKKDEISRTGETWKELGSIAELATFFAASPEAEGAATEEYQAIEDAPTKATRDPTHKGVAPPARTAKATMLGVAPGATPAPTAAPAPTATAPSAAVIGRAVSPTLETAATLRSRPEAAGPAPAATPARPVPQLALTPPPPARPPTAPTATPAPPVRPVDAPPRARVPTPRGMAPPAGQPPATAPAVRPAPAPRISATREPTPAPATRAPAAVRTAMDSSSVQAAPRDSFDASLMPAVAVVEPSGDVGSVRPSMGPQPAWATAGETLGRVPDDAESARSGESTSPPVVRRSRAVGIILMVVVLAVVLGGAVALAGPGIAHFFGGAFSAPPPPQPREDRAGAFVAQARTTLLADRDEDLERAIGLFQQALGVSADDARALAGLGETLALQAQVLRDQADDLDEKARRLRPSDGSDPTVARAELQARSKVLRESSTAKVAEARGFAERATKASPEMPEAHRALADAQRLAGDLPTARTSLARALAQDATSAENRYASAMLALETPDTKPQARVDLREAILANPRMVRAILRLARLDALEGDVASARAGAQRALDVQPNHPRARALLAAIDVGDPPVVPVEIVGTDTATPDGGPPAAPDGGATRPPTTPGPGETPGANPPAGRSPDWYVSEGERLQRNGQAEQARRLFEQALALQPSRSEALAGLGFVLLSLGDARGATTQFRRLLDSNPSYAAGYFGMAQAAQRLGQNAVAAQNYRRFLESSSSGPRAETARRFLEQMGGSGDEPNGPPPDQGTPPPPDQGTPPPPDQGAPPPPPDEGLPAPRDMAPGTVPPSDRPAPESEPSGLPPVTGP